MRRYVHGPGLDEPLAWLEGSGSADRRWLLADQLGSVVAVTNGSGALTQANTYDAYGQPGQSNLGRFQYTGQAFLPDTGLHHYKARAYHPALGRFLQPDPIGTAGGINLYAYVGNDPLNGRDPWGLCNNRTTEATCGEESVIVTGKGGGGGLRNPFGYPVVGSDPMGPDGRGTESRGSEEDVVVIAKRPVRAPLRIIGQKDHDGEEDVVSKRPERCWGRGGIGPLCDGMTFEELRRADPVRDSAMQ